MRNPGFSWLQGWWRLGALGLLLGLVGCQGGTSRWTASQSGTSPTLAATPPKDPEQSELSSKETARLCLTTAQGMDREGRAAEAIALYNKARQLDPGQNGLCRRLAVLYDRVGDFASAGREYSEALRLAPRDASIFNDLGYSCYCQGRWADAEKYLRKAVEIDPKTEHAWVNLGLVLAVQGHYTESLATFQKVVPEAQAHCNLAFIQASQGKRGEAMDSYRTAQRLSPELGLARQALAKLEQPPTRPSEGLARRPETPTPLPGAIASGEGTGTLGEPAPIAHSGFTPMPWETAKPPIQQAVSWERPLR